VYAAVQSFLNNDESNPSGYPKAFLNWIFLDDQFNYVSSLSGAVQAASSTYPAATLNTVAPGSQLTMTKNGYLYIWVSNETQGWDVFFDNLSVQHRQGPVLEENHYYPFGLTMQGLSDKAIKTNYAENKFRYNSGTELQNKEFSDGTGLELYETSFRNFDPQLGRFGQIDPMADMFHFFSAYQYSINNPVRFCDPSGLKAESIEEYEQYNPARQQVINSWADPLDHADNSALSWLNSEAAGGGPEEHEAQKSYYSPWGYGKYSLYWYTLFMNSPDGITKYYNPESSDNSSTSYVVMYNYVNATGSGQFETPNYHGEYTYTEGQSYHYIGTTTKQFLPDVSDATESDEATTWDYITTGLATLGGIVEMGVGALTIEFGFGGFLMVDGASRAILGGAKLYALATDKKSIAETVPENMLGAFGYAVDHVTNSNMSDDQIGSWQNGLGTVNEAISLILSPYTEEYAPNGIIKTADIWLNGPRGVNGPIGSYGQKAFPQLLGGQH